jgi:hypothetical protein
VRYAQPVSHSFIWSPQKFQCWSILLQLLKCKTNKLSARAHKNNPQGGAVCAETCHPVGNICYILNIWVFKLSGRVSSTIFHRRGATWNYVGHSEYGGNTYLWNVKTVLLSYLSKKTKRLSSDCTYVTVYINLIVSNWYALGCKIVSLNICIHEYAIWFLFLFSFLKSSRFLKTIKY